MNLNAWVELLGGGGIVATLSGLTVILIRIGRFAERSDDHERRLTRLEGWQDGVRFGAGLRQS